MNAFLIAIVSQIFFTASDIIAHKYLKTQGFHSQSFLQPWFAGYLVVRVLATTGQLYVLSSTELGKTMLLFAIMSIILTNIIGLLYFNEVVPLTGYLAIALAITALILIILS